MRLPRPLPGLALVAAALLALPALAVEPAGTPAGGVTVAGVQPGVVDGPTARRLVAAGVKVVDVRTRAEFDAGHVPGALNIPFEEVGRRSGEIGPASTPVLLYCRTGRRSAIAAGALRDEGFTRIFDLQAYDRWVRSASAGAP